MAKSTWFTHEIMSTQQAEDLIKQYTLRNIQTKKQLSADYTGWYVSALLPEYKSEPRQSYVWQNPMWR
ncbi:hypothetical protein J1782_25065 [Rahnella sp. BCC 1045]|uniref:hypothetical protein n=1 Tax=Rahnella sp. BCC 1045 TaxID=2816251 RepID=UPI001C2739AC|nr:hypothetical protein [Rahnella sp. BCC 1045]MBU9823166.1 hypothetical protein [Rahnella sp. BCC 1045]